MLKRHRYSKHLGQVFDRFPIRRLKPDHMELGSNCHTQWIHLQQLVLQHHPLYEFAH